MTRQVRKERLASRNYEVIIVKYMSTESVDDNGRPFAIDYLAWLVRNRETMADTEQSDSWDDYAKLKRVWRKSKEDFESACRFMKFGDLFSAAGIDL